MKAKKKQPDPPPDPEEAAQEPQEPQQRPPSQASQATEEQRSSSSDDCAPPEPQKKVKKTNETESVPKKKKPVMKPRQLFKIDDEKLEESILEWMQIEENDFLWNSQRTEYRYPDKKRARFAEKEAAINSIHPDLHLAGE